MHFVTLFCKVPCKRKTQKHSKICMTVLHSVVVTNMGCIHAMPSSDWFADNVHQTS